MIRTNINGKDYGVPTSFEDISLGKYCEVFFKVREEGDDFNAIRRNESKVISRLLGEEDGFCLDLPLPMYEHLREMCSFIYSTDSLKHSNSITINGKVYRVPKVREMSLRQWIDIDVISQEEDNPQRFLHILGALLVEEGKSYQGDYLEVAEKASSVPCSDGLGIVYHFFWKGESLRKISKACSMAERLSQ